MVGVCAALCGCHGVPEMGPHEERVFRRAPALVDTAVLAAEVIPGASITKHEDGDPIDYDAHNGRRIRVTFDPKKSVTRVMVTHAGFGGPEEARRVLDRIQEWIEQTDGVGPRPRKPRTLLP